MKGKKTILLENNYLGKLYVFICICIADVRGKLYIYTMWGPKAILYTPIYDGMRS